MFELALVDAHCHLDRLDLHNYNNELSRVLNVAHEIGVRYVLCPGITLENFPEVLKIAKTYPNVWATVGVHPTEEGARVPSVDELCTLAADSRVVGIGETGLDYANCVNDFVEQNKQKELFITHIRAAKLVKKPLVIHSRMAAHDILQILRVEDAAEIGGMLHCFAEDWATAQAAMEMGFYISFSGIITFKNADALRAVAVKVPMDRVLLETDAPYLSPVPKRGRPNEPAYLRYTAEYFAGLREVSLQEVASITTENFFRLFKLNDEL
jgi:TatD DNase family protein